MLSARYFSYNVTKKTDYNFWHGERTFRWAIGENLIEIADYRGDKVNNPPQLMVTGQELLENLES